VIFIQALCDLVKKLKENKGKTDEEIFLGSFSLKQIREEYLVIQRPPQFIISSYKFGYEVDNPSFEFLRHRILNEPNGGTIHETFYTLNLENARAFFEQNLLKVYHDEGLSSI